MSEIPDTPPLPETTEPEREELDDRGMVQETEDHLRMLVNYHNDVQAVMVDPRAVLGLFNRIDATESDLAQTRSRPQELREALEPFMVAHGEFHPDFWATRWCRSCDLCAAVAALAALEGK